MKDTTKQHGFTLAEVLITLVIIGVISALTIPSVVRNYKDKVLEASFKKGYSTLVQMYEKTCIDNNLKYQDVVDLFKTDEGKQNFREMFYKSNPNLDSACFDKTNAKCRIGSSVFFSGYKGVNKIFTKNSWFELLSNGMAISFQDAPGGINHFIVLDTNGLKNGPNWAGHDVFFFLLDNKNRLIPRTRGNCKIDFVCSNCAGGGCAYYALKNECPSDGNLNYWKCLD